MDSTLARTIISRLNRFAFQSFIPQYFQFGYGKELIHPFQPAPDQVFIRDLNDYIFGSEEQKHYGLFDAAYISHFFPIELASNPFDIRLDEPSLIKKIKAVRDYYKDKLGYVEHMVGAQPRLRSIFFLNNFSGFSREDYIDKLIPKYEQLLIDNGLNDKFVGVGNIDSFFDLRPDETLQSFTKFIKGHSDGLCISISPHGAIVNKYAFEKNIIGGVTPRHKAIYEPIYIANQPDFKDIILKEFEALLNLEVKESRLEEFLTSNYGLIFGPKYDRIETQLWLRFPDLDINRKDRRLDLFLRNSVTNDWELFEIKRVIKLTQSYRDTPVLAREVVYAIQQVQNYHRILTQDSVKKHFAEKGIEYFEPILHLVVGRDPQIPHEQWRWLISSNKDVKLITYDELLREVEIRIRDRFSMGK